MAVDTAERGQSTRDDGVPTRTITRRRGLPRGRALLGGFLVALAAVGLFAAYRRAEAPPAVSYAVVTADVVPGQRLSEEELALVPIDLPAAQAATAYTQLDPLVGAVANSALSAGQVVADSDVRASVGYTAAGELSLPLAASNALGGALVPGERVDVIAAYGSGADAYTMTVVRDALVIAQQSGDTFAGSDTVIVRLGVDEADAALALAHAVTQAEVFLARSPDGDPGTGPYRPAAAAVPAATGGGATAGGEAATSGPRS